jgi:hypothetical protein
MSGNEFMVLSGAVVLLVAFWRRRSATMTPVMFWVGVIIGAGSVISGLAAIVLQ